MKAALILMMRKANRANSTRAKGKAYPFVAVALLALVALFISAEVSRAQVQRVSTAEYTSRVERAATSLDALLAIEREAGAATRGEAWARAEVIKVLPTTRERTLRDVRASLPPTLTVERGNAGPPVETDNRRLHADLTRYEHQRPDEPDAAERVETLEGAVGRLRALAARLGEAAPSSQRDKDAEKGRLAAILRGKDFAERGARGSALESLIEKIVEWIRSLFPERQSIEPGPSTGASSAAQYVIYAVALAAIGVVFWFYWRRRAPRAARPKRKEARIVLGERLEPDQTAADILDDAERLAREGNLRGAIRKAYVALLCELGDRHVVQLAQHKTNRDYLQSVRERAPRVYGLFSPLTLSFERHWYGLADATHEDWDSFRAGCRRALEAD